MIALFDRFLKRRITYIMYSLGGLCIVCTGIVPAVFLAGLWGGIFLGGGTVAEGWWQGERMLVPPLHPCKKSG